MAFDALCDEDLYRADEKPTGHGSDCVYVRSLTIGGEVKDVTFRATATQDHNRHKAASSLLNSRYAWRGYGSSHVIPFGAHHTTFTTEIDETVVGTLTLAIDSEYGLAIDQSFPEYTDDARNASSSRICELTRFAFNGDVRSKEALAGLFHMVFIYGTTISDCSDLFIEVHPRHASFYQGMLEFEPVGRPGINASVGAPSQLMRLGVDTIRQRISERSERVGQYSHRSLYPYFFSHVQELQIRSVLALRDITLGPARDPVMTAPAALLTMADDKSAGKSRSRHTGNDCHAPSTIGSVARRAA